MNKPLRVLLVEDSADDAQLVLRELRRGGYEPTHQRVDTAEAMAAALKGHTWDIVIADYSMPHFSGPAALALLKESEFDLPLIIVSGTIGEESAVAAMKAGADDYLMKDNLARLVPAVERELREADVRRQRKRADRALIDSEEMFRSLSACSPVGILLTDADGRCTYANPRARAMFGLTLMQSVGRGWMQAIHPEDQAWMLDEWSESVRMGLEYSRDFRVQTRDGAVRWMHLRSAPMLRDGGRPMGHVATIEDVSEAKQAEKALRDAEAKYRTLVEHLPAVTYVAEFGENGRWHYVSPQIEQLLGFSTSEWITNPQLWFSQLHPDDRQRVMGEESECRTGQKAFQSEYRLTARDGRVVWCRDEGVVLGTAADGPILMQGVILDITERINLEEQLLQSQKVEAIGRLAGGVAHDFNNILTVIMGCTDLLLRIPKLAPGLLKNAEEIRKAADRAASLTHQLLAFSRKQVLDPKVLDLNNVVSQIEKMLRRLIGEDITLVTVPHQASACVKADPGQIEQVIMNMVVNARDAMPDGGTITIKTANVRLDEKSMRVRQGFTAGDYVLLTISDTGSGMSNEVKAHIFEPFFTTKEQGRGTGLGLATCYGIVKQSGGHIHVQSELGRGTTFEIYLPRVEQEANELPERKSPEQLPSGSETVLLVEDEEAVRELTSSVLSDLGYTVLQAGDGVDALQVAERHAGEIELVITDVVMPKMGGTQLAARLRSTRPNVKVLFNSGYTEDAIVHHGVVDAGIAFLQKPYTPDALARKVREVLTNHTGRN